MLVIALGDTSRDEELYFMLQHRDHYTEQDVELRMNQPYIEFGSQARSWYGHIVEFELLRDRVKVKMNEAAASCMGNDGLIEVGFTLNEHEFARLREALRRTFREQRYFVERV